MMRPFAILLLSGAAALALSACGKQGDLEQPAPLWGAKAKAEYEARQRSAQQHPKATDASPTAASGQNAQAGSTSPTDVPAPTDQASGTIQPARTVPLPGAKPDPNASAPPGVLPDPYARPQ
jgi:hypothetical protein